MLPYIKLFGDMSATIDLLSDAEAGRLLKSLLHYANGEETEPSGQEKLVFAMLKSMIDRDAAAYEAYCEKQRENGKKGGRPKNPVVYSGNPKNPVVNSNNPKNPVVFLKTQKSQEKEEEKEEDYYPPIIPPLADEEELKTVNRDHRDIIDRMEYVGFPMDTAVIDKVIGMYADHGKDAVLHSLDECIGVEGNKLRYLTKVIENYGKDKASSGNLSLEEQWAIYNSSV